MAETTVWWSAVERLVSLLRVHPSLIGSVDVHSGWPGDLHRKPEMVFVDELSSTEDRPVMKSGRPSPVVSRGSRLIRVCGTPVPSTCIVS